MKKILSIMMMMISACFLVGCGSSENGAAQASSAAQERPSDAVIDKIPDGLQGKKALIAYYSWSGHTKAVAEQIQQEIGADIFFIQPGKEYPQDYSECVDIAKTERNENARPPVSSTVDNMGQYDVIFVGYPIWWGKAPMFIYTFLEQYDLNGKIIVPFCTTGGTPIDGSITDIRTSAAGAQIVQGSESSDPAAVSEWLKNIGAVQ